MRSLILWIVNTFSIQDKTAVVTGILSGKMNKTDKQKMIANIVKNLQDLDTKAIATDIFSGSDQAVQRAILEDILKVAVAGGEGYFAGGTPAAEAAAALEAAKILYDTLGKMQAKNASSSGSAN